MHDGFKHAHGVPRAATAQEPPLQDESRRHASVGARHASSTSWPQPSKNDESPHSPLGQEEPSTQVASAQWEYVVSIGPATPAHTHTLPGPHSPSFAQGYTQPHTNTSGRLPMTSSIRAQCPCGMPVQSASEEQVFDVSVPLHTGGTPSVVEHATA
jgi:hypothetical protein